MCKQDLHRSRSHSSYCCRVCNIHVIFDGCVWSFSGTVTRQSRYRKESPRACAEQQTWCRSKDRVLLFLHLGRDFWYRFCFGFWRRDNKSRGEEAKGQGWQVQTCMILLWTHMKDRRDKKDSWSVVLLTFINSTWTDFHTRPYPGYAVWLLILLVVGSRDVFWLSRQRDSFISMISSRTCYSPIWDGCLPYLQIRGSWTDSIVSSKFECSFAVCQMSQMGSVMRGTGLEGRAMESQETCRSRAVKNYWGT